MSRKESKFYVIIFINPRNFNTKRNENAYSEIR